MWLSNKCIPKAETLLTLSVMSYRCLVGQLLISEYMWDVQIALWSYGLGGLTPTGTFAIRKSVSIVVSIFISRQTFSFDEPFWSPER
jgi:hypothetical protein